MKIQWIVDKDICLSPSILSDMQRAADQSLPSEGIPFPCLISVRLCGLQPIRSINRAYRKKDQATDVLSFPSLNFPKGKTAGCCLSLLQNEYDEEENACFLGDIIISVPHILNQAQEYCHSAAREAAYLLVHGICHLMGYDHMETGEKEIMRMQEEKILKAANLSRNADSDGLDQELMQSAREAMQKSYSPYSRFKVGAALHTRDGRIFTGCNVENASLGLTNCAERTAVFKAISEGCRSFDVIAIAAASPAWPCGACRQVLNEFAPDIRVIVTWGNGEYAMKSLRELLPESFGPEDLGINMEP